MIKSLSKIRKQNKDKFKVPKSAQDVVDAEVIYKDGILRLEIVIQKPIALKILTIPFHRKKKK